jgi:ABC-2 type transport system permease protein
MSKYLFFYNIKSNKYLVLSFSAILLMYTTIAVGMFNPENADMMESMVKMLPEEMVKAFGFEGLGTELTRYLGGYLYGFIYFMFPGILAVILGNKLMAKHVDSGSMAYLLTTPHSRVKIAVTQAIFFITAILTVFVINVGVAIIMAEVLFPGMLKIGQYLMLNVVTFSGLTFIASTLFFFSTLFNESRHALAAGSTLPVFFFVFNAVRNINESLDFLKFFTIFTIVDIDKIFEGGSYAPTVSIIVFLVSALIFSASIYMFDRRSLVI